MMQKSGSIDSTLPKVESSPSYRAISRDAFVERVRFFESALSPTSAEFMDPSCISQTGGSMEPNEVTDEDYSSNESRYSWTSASLRTELRLACPTALPNEKLWKEEDFSRLVDGLGPDRSGSRSKNDLTHSETTVQIKELRHARSKSTIKGRARLAEQDTTRFPRPSPPKGGQLESNSIKASHRKTQSTARKSLPSHWLTESPKSSSHQKKRTDTVQSARSTGTPPKATSKDKAADSGSPRASPRTVGKMPNLATAKRAAARESRKDQSKAETKPSEPEVIPSATDVPQWDWSHCTPIVLPDKPRRRSLEPDDLYLDLVVDGHLMPGTLARAYIDGQSWMENPLPWDDYRPKIDSTPAYLDPRKWRAGPPAWLWNIGPPTWTESNQLQLESGPSRQGFDLDWELRVDGHVIPEVFVRAYLDRRIWFDKESGHRPWEVADPKPEPLSPEYLDPRNWGHGQPRWVRERMFPISEMHDDPYPKEYDEPYGWEYDDSQVEGVYEDTWPDNGEITDQGESNGLEEEVEDSQAHPGSPSNNPFVSSQLDGSSDATPVPPENDKQTRSNVRFATAGDVDESHNPAAVADETGKAVDTESCAGDSLAVGPPTDADSTLSERQVSRSTINSPCPSDVSRGGLVSLSRSNLMTDVVMDLRKPEGHDQSHGASSLNDSAGQHQVMATRDTADASAMTTTAKDNHPEASSTSNGADCNSTTASHLRPAAPPFVPKGLTSTICEDLGAEDGGKLTPSNDTEGTTAFASQFELLEASQSKIPPPGETSTIVRSVWSLPGPINPIPGPEVGGLYSKTLRRKYMKRSRRAANEMLQGNEIHTEVDWPLWDPSSESGDNKSAGSGPFSQGSNGPSGHDGVNGQANGNRRRSRSPKKGGLGGNYYEDAGRQAGVSVWTNPYGMASAAAFSFPPPNGMINNNNLVGAPQAPPNPDMAASGAEPPAAPYVGYSYVVEPCGDVEHLVGLPCPACSARYKLGLD